MVFDWETWQRREVSLMPSIVSRLNSTQQAVVFTGDLGDVFRRVTMCYVLARYASFSFR